MALVVKDRVQVTSTTTGTGTFTLGSAVAGFQDFSVIGNANTTYYAIVGGSEWEVGLGTYTSSGTTLSRDTILESSNNGNAVNFSAGTKNVFVTYPAEKSVYLDNSDKLNVNANGLTFNDNTTQNTSAYGGGFAFRNRIINGDMRIDQRNAGASVTPTDGAFVTDRWKFGVSQASKFTSQQSTTAPTGFTNSLLITSSSAYSIVAGDYFNFQQRIEGFNTADLAWGTASASAVTLSFWVRSSLTGTFGGALSNSSSNRSYPFTYTISSANTWEQKSVTIAGDTSGTWATNNSIGILASFGFGVGSTYSGTAGSWAGAYYLSATGATSVVGTNGATFYITGVQLEKGSTATSFDYRPYGTELALCQRYYYKIQATAADSPFSMGSVTTTTLADIIVPFPVSMRTNPTALEQTGTAGDYRVRTQSTDTTCSSVPILINNATTTTSQVRFTVASGLTAGNAAIGRSVNSSAYLAWSSEL